MEIVNYLEVWQKLERDKAAGTRIARLTGDDNCSLFAVEIAPGTVLPAHYHREGSEIYQLLAGEGEIALGNLLDGDVIWREKMVIKRGDCLTIAPNSVHRLANPGRTNLQLLCTAPPAHLGDDRTFVGER
ncbi:MAG: cupin domain-containing protein [bacterium]